MSAIIPAGTEGALAPLNIERALALVKSSRDLSELAAIRDQAEVLKKLARTRDASLETQNAAGEVMLRATRRIDEVLEEKKASGERQARGDAGRAKANAPKVQAERLVPPPATLEDLGIERNVARRARLVGQVPEEKLDAYVQVAREKGEEITTSGFLQFASKRNPHAASNVNNAEPDKNERFTPEWWVRELKARWNLNWDLAGHPLAPATRVFGRGQIWTIEDDCFRQNWTGKRGLGNWEWDALNRFVPWAWFKVATKEAPIVVQPMPGNRFEQRFAREFIEPFRPDCGGSGVRVHFPHRRVGYGTILDPEGERDDNAPGLPSAAVIFEGPFVRSPDVPPVGTIDEVIAEVRRHFGEDAAGWEHLWRQALQLARGEAPAPNLDRRTSGGARRALVREASEDMLVDRFRGEAQNLGFSASVFLSDGEMRLRCLSKKCNVLGGERFAFRIWTGRVERSIAQLQRLREHVRSHQVKPKPSKKPPSKKKGRKR